MSSVVEAPEVVRPLFCSVPPALSSSGEEATELAASAGLVLDPWQAWALDQSLGERPDGRWSAFEVAVIVSRQNGKGSIIEARELAGLFLLDEQLIIHTAHEFKTAAEAFRRIRTLIEGAPHLRRRCKPPRMASGEEGIETLDGRRLKFVARSSGSGRGFSGDLVILDEAFALAGEEMAALLPTLSARPNPQLWYTSSAGMASSTYLRSVRDRGRAGGDPALCWLEWCAAAEAAGLDPLDREGWRRANPGVPARIDEEFIEREQRALPPEYFLRERLGVWDSPDSAQRKLGPADWRATALDVRPDGRPAFFVTVEPGQLSASIAVAADGPSVPHVELADHRPGVGWLVDRLNELAAACPGAPIGAGKAGPVFGMAEALERAGLAVEFVSLPWWAQACAHAEKLLGTRVLTHSDEPLVSDVLPGLAVREQEQAAWVIDWRKSTGNVAPLAAEIGALFLLEQHRAADYDLLASVQ